MKINDYELQILDNETIIKIDKILSLFLYGELIIIRHDKTLVMDTKIRDRKTTIKLNK